MAVKVTGKVYPPGVEPPVPATREQLEAKILVIEKQLKDPRFNTDQHKQRLADVKARLEAME